MQRSVVISMVVFVGSAFLSGTGTAKVGFADEAISTDLEPLLEEYEVLWDMHSALSLSDMTYAIRYGQTEDHAEGRFEYDGENLYITLNSDGHYSLQARLTYASVADFVTCSCFALNVRWLLMLEGGDAWV